VVDRLVEAFRVVANKPETHGKLLAIDTFPSYQDPVAFRAQIQRNLREWTEIAERLNLSVEG
jgi:tripartite-type tricarboxylate transporter receptor subunit TctC